MTSDHWLERLSEYLDGDMSAADRGACAAHLDRCRECVTALEEVREIVAGAALLPDIPPERDLWPQIEGRLEPRVMVEGQDGPSGAFAGSTESIASDGSARVIPLRPRTRRVEVGIPQLIAAGIALVLFSASAVYVSVAPGPGAARAPLAAAAPTATATPVLFTAEYEALVTDLQAEFLRRRDQLDPETVRVVEQNLMIIDRAINEARQALVEDPASGFLNTHLAGAMKRKVDLLRQAAVIQQTQI